MPFKKKYVPYVPRLMPPQLAPEAITWGHDSKERIIELLKQDRTVGEIAVTTKNRPAYVRTVAKRFFNPEEFEQPSPILRPRITSRPKIHSCYCCGTSESSRWYGNTNATELCAECKKYLTSSSKPPKAPRVKKTITLLCKHCSKPFEVWPSKKDRKKFCSFACYQKHGIPGRTRASRAVVGGVNGPV